MYRFGKATGPGKTAGGRYYVTVVDEYGTGYLNHYDEKAGDWVVRIFATEEEARRAIKEFNEFSWED